MSDWADEIGNEIQCDYCADNGCESAVAAALRAAYLRGRIAGLREAAEIGQKHFDDWSGSGEGAFRTGAAVLRNAINYRADALEQGDE